MSTEQELRKCQVRIELIVVGETRTDRKLVLISDYKRIQNHVHSCGGVQGHDFEGPHVSFWHQCKCGLFWVVR